MVMQMGYGNTNVLAKGGRSSGKYAHVDFGISESAIAMCLCL